MTIGRRTEAGDNTPVDAERRPFLSAARTYLELGYDPLPLPPSKKYPPPRGFTGHAGRPVGAEDLERWLQQEREVVGVEQRGRNIALRLPTNVVGISPTSS